MMTQKEILEVLQEQYETQQLYEAMDQIRKEEEEALEEARMYGIGRKIIYEDGYVVYDNYSY